MQASSVEAAPTPQRRQRSCVANGCVAFIDGAFFGGAIGGIINSAQAMSGLASGAETMGSALRHVIRSSARSGISLGLALATYSSGVCSLERARGKRDVANPFLVGGMLGAVGSIQTVELHDGQRKTRALAANPRAMIGGTLSSAMLCALFWQMQRSGQQRRLEESAADEVTRPSTKAAVPQTPAADPAVTDANDLPTPAFVLDDLTNDADAAVPTLGVAPHLAAAVGAMSYTFGSEPMTVNAAETLEPAPSIEAAPHPINVAVPQDALPPKPGPAAETLHDPWANK